jgi:hypothetical protein
MVIDRRRFLELAALLYSAGPVATLACDRGSPPPATVVPVQLPAASTTPPPPSAAPIASAPAVPADACSNAKGDARSACLKVTSACEGLRDECESLHEDLRPRVAQQFAECFAQTRAPRCRDKALGACMRRAIESACVEPGATARCETIMRACTAAGKRPKYSLETCAKILSAIVPGGPGQWDEVDEERLGPSTAEGCSLEYVLPYQPYGFSWR